MITHSSEILLELVPENNKYQLAKDYNIVITIESQSYSIWIPKGFEYDGATIPALFWQTMYSPFAPDVMRAALVHDWLYYTHKAQQIAIDRKTADKIFKAIIEADGVKGNKANLMYTALLVGGQPAWKNTPPQNKYLNGFRERLGAEAAKFGL